MTDFDDETPDRGPVRESDSHRPPHLSTRSLFEPGENEIRIDHNGIEYRLRITKGNRLILFR